MDTAFGWVGTTFPYHGQSFSDDIPDLWTVPILRKLKPWTSQFHSFSFAKPRTVGTASEGRLCYNSAHNPKTERSSMAKLLFLLRNQSSLFTPKASYTAVKSSIALCPSKYDPSQYGEAASPA